MSSTISKENLPSSSGNYGMRSLLVRASAGTGKTYRLAGRLLQLLLRGADASSILATTFTRKAAGEILQRIFLTLAAAAKSESELQKLRDQVNDQKVSAHQCRDLLQQLMRELHRLNVCTLDSLFSQLARSFPVELRLPPGWRLTDDIEEEWIRRRAIDAMLAAIDPDQLESLISMLHKGEATRSIDRELQIIIADGFSDARWCDAKAWCSLRVPKMPATNEMETAVEALANAAIGHRSADKNLQAIATDILESRWEEIANRDIVGNAHRAAGNDEELTYYKKPVPPELIDALTIAFQAAESHLLQLLHHQSDATGQMLMIFGGHVESLKQQLRALSFDDVSFRLASWISSLDFRELALRLDADLRHLLLDEFQDTAPMQWAVLKPLAIHVTDSETAGSFFCVGDTKQAIYGWRGGKAAIFDAVQRQVPGVDSDSQNLSFRSSPVIMDFVTNVFQNLTNHPAFAAIDGDPLGKEAFEVRAVTDFARDFPDHQSAKKDLPGMVCLRTGSEPPHFLESVADRITELANAKPSASIGVLTRRNQTVAELIFYLKQRDVDVSQEGGNPLTDSALVELVLSALMLSEHPSDLRWAYHVAQSPLGELLRLHPLKPAQGKDWQDQLQAVSLAADRVRERLEYEGLSHTLRWLGDQLIPIASENDALRLRQLLMLAHPYEANPQPRISRFVDLVRRKKVQRPRPAQVRVMTVHQAKGLEFDTVVLPELDGQLTRMDRQVIARATSPVDPPEALLRYISSKRWNILPKRWQQAFGETAASAMTEALCLMYVALTRPRENLEIIIRPASNAAFKSKTPAALIYHALECKEDPTAANTELIQFSGSLNR